MSKKSLIISAIAGAMALVFVIIFAISCNTTPKEPQNSDFSEASAPNTESPVMVMPSVTLSFIGDCIIGSNEGIANEGGFTWYAEQKPHEYFFEKVYDVLSKDTFTFANVECVITDRDLEKTEKDYDPAYWFKAPTKDTDILTKGSVEVAGIVNNHTMDYGEEGYEDTKAALAAEGIKVGEDCEALYLEANGIKIGVCYAQLWSEYQLTYIEECLEEMQGKCDYKIVFFHGGEESVHEPDEFKVNCARKLAEAGLCNLIVGSHPHVLQPMEVVNGVPIVYSLGNFCYSASNYPENKTIIFQVMLTQDEGMVHTSTRIVPCQVYTGDRNNWQPAIITGEYEYNEIIELMHTPVKSALSTYTEPEEEPVYEYESEAPVYTEDPVYTEAPIDTGGYVETEYYEETPSE